MNIKLIIRAAILVLPASVGYLIYFFHVRSIQSTIEDVSLLEDAAGEVDDNVPLKASEYVEKFQVTSLKERADQIRRRYNRDVQISRAVREHLQELYEHGYVCSWVEGQVRRQLDEIDRRNEQLRVQYGEIVEFAEKYYAESVTKKVSTQTGRNL